MHYVNIIPNFVSVWPPRGCLPQEPAPEACQDLVQLHLPSQLQRSKNPPEKKEISNVTDSLEESH